MYVTHITMKTCLEPPSRFQVASLKGSKSTNEEGKCQFYAYWEGLGTKNSKNQGFWRGIKD